MEDLPVQQFVESREAIIGALSKCTKLNRPRTVGQSIAANFVVSQSVDGEFVVCS